MVEVENFSKGLLGKLREIEIDWPLFISAFLISLAGLVTMNAFVGDNYFFNRQIIWLGVSLCVFLVASAIDWRMLRRSNIIVGLFLVSTLLLLTLFVLGSTFKGAQSWFNFGGFAFQPSDFSKLVLIALLSKYLSRRHIEIAHVKHIFISGIYALIFFGLILVQPDFGAAIIIFMVWFGMILVSGISKKHLLGVVFLGALSFFLLWTFVFAPYQKQRILTFINPLADVRGAGYNAYQSTIAVGSGKILGKGVGYGTQSKLQFLPEYETDFIFAAFAEEWGFVGSIIIIVLYGILIWRILIISSHGSGNFEMFFGLGISILFVSNILVHIGMNIGLLPVTGVTAPFMSYGGSHLIIEFLALGILMGMKRYSRAVHREDAQNEIPGI